MGLKTLSTKCTFASLIRLKKKTPRICWFLGIKVRPSNNQGLILQKKLTNSISLSHLLIINLSSYLILDFPDLEHSLVLSSFVLANSCFTY
jgi:hypothetical protein